MKAARKYKASSPKKVKTASHHFLQKKGNASFFGAKNSTRS
ncbi:MAG: hypothetical protein ACPG5B_15755 [Chitinophagales bacterium]